MSDILLKIKYVQVTAALKYAKYPPNKVLAISTKGQSPLQIKKGKDFFFVHKENMRA